MKLTLIIVKWLCAFFALAMCMLLGYLVLSEQSHKITIWNVLSILMNCVAYALLSYQQRRFYND